MYCSIPNIMETHNSSIYGFKLYISPMFYLQIPGLILIYRYIDIPVGMTVISSSQSADCRSQARGW